MNLGIIRQVFVHCLYLYYKKIMWNCAFAMLNRLWDVPCLNERIFKRVSLNHFIVVTSSQAVYPYIMEWEVEKILQLLSQDCRCKWQTNDQWVCHDEAGAGGGSGGGSAPGQAARAHPAAQPGAGHQGARDSPGPRHQAPPWARTKRFKRSLSPTEPYKGTATILNMETYPDILPIGYSWKTIASMKYLLVLKFRRISKHVLLQPSHKYFLPPFPLCNVEKLFRIFKYFFQFVSMNNV